MVRVQRELLAFLSESHLCVGWINVWPWAVQLLPVGATCAVFIPGLRFTADSPG